MSQFLFERPYIFIIAGLLIGFVFAYFTWKVQEESESLKPPRTYQGEIYEKIFHPETEEVSLMPIPMGKTVGVIPRMKMIPARWEIRIRQWDEKTTSYFKNEVFVEEEVAKKYEIGDHFKVWDHEVEYKLD